MPYTSTVGRHACRIHLPQSTTTCYSASAAGGVFARTWPADPAEVTAAADFRGAPFGDLLCIGCTRLYDRLVAEGKLP